MVEFVIKSAFDDAGVKKAEAAMQRMYDSSNLPALSGGGVSAGGGGLPDISKLNNSFDALIKSNRQLANAVLKAARMPGLPDETPGNGGGGGNGGGKQKEESSALDKIIKSVLARNAVNGVSGLLELQTAQRNRSGIMSSAASGDVMGAGAEILNRNAEMNKAYMQSGMGVASGAALGLNFVAPGVGTAVSAGLQLATPLIGSIMDSFGDKAKAQDIMTRGTLSDVYLSKYKGIRSHGLLTGMDDSAFQIGTRGLQGQDIGYSALEMMDFEARYAKQSGGGNTMGGTYSALSAARNTGTDAEAMLGLNAQFARYGTPSTKDGWAVNAAYGGNKAMGGNNATMEEFTRAMTRVFSDGMSKGLVRGSNDIAKQISGVANWMGVKDSSGYYQNAENVASTLGGMNRIAGGASNVSDAMDSLIYKTAGDMVRGGKADDILKAQGYDITGLRDSTKAQLLANSGIKTPELMQQVNEAMKAMGGDVNYRYQAFKSKGMEDRSALTLSQSGEYTSGGGAMAIDNIPKTTADKNIATGNQLANNALLEGLKIQEQISKDYLTIIPAIEEQYKKIGDLTETLNETNQAILDSVQAANQLTEYQHQLLAQLGE